MAGRSRILMVDDDQVLVEATKLVLESRDYQVLVAYDGESGLAIASAEKPDLIILDVIMPDKDGFAVCEELKANPELANIPVLMMTSFAKDKGTTNIPVSDGFSLEAEGYVDKPVSPERLLGLVEKMLQNA
jgi:two-component system, OmpR family, alkaline phosphatase synthesis response regulator PhoP